MKSSIFLLLAIFALSYAAPPPLHDDGKLHIPDKCEDVLAVKVCDNLEQLALRLKLKAEDVTKAVVDAVKQGKTSSVEIYNAAKDFLMKEVMTKKCEDFTTAEKCKKLREVAAFLKVKADKVEEFVIKAVAEGAVKAEEIYKKAMEYYKAEVATKKCEDFLSATQCTQLRNIAAKLKIKFDDLEDAIKEAYLEALGDAKAMFSKVVATLKDYALNTKCEDLLNPDLCAALRRFAQTTKVQFPVLMEKAVDLLIKGYDVSKDLVKKIYSIVDYMYDCTDIFDQSSCDRLYKMAGYLGLAHQKVEEFLKKYVPIAIEKGKDIINDFPSLMKELGKYLKDQWCKVTPFCFEADQQDEIMFADADDFSFEKLKQIMKEYIEQRFPGLQDKVKQKIFEIINKAKSIGQFVKDAVHEMIFVGGESADKIKEILKDLLANIKSMFEKQPTDISDEVNDLATDFETLKQKLKDFIEEKYPGLQDKVKQKILKVINDAKSTFELIVNAIKEISKAGGDAGKKVVEILKNLVEKIRTEVQNDEVMVKRDVSSDDWKQKVLDYINNKYPGLSEKVKQKVQELVTKARNYWTFMYKAFQEVVATKIPELKKIVLDMVNKLKELMRN